MVVDAGTDASAVLGQSADIAEATLGDSLTTGRARQVAVAALVAHPSEPRLTAARLP